MELDAGNPKSYNNRGALLLKMGKYDEACTNFERAIALHPEYEVAARNLVVAKEQQAKEVDGAAKRAQLYARRASGGEAMMYRGGDAAERLSANDGGGGGGTARKSMAAAAGEHDDHLGGKAQAAGVVTYTDGGSMAAAAMLTGREKQPSIKDGDHRKSTAL